MIGLRGLVLVALVGAVASLPACARIRNLGKGAPETDLGYRAAVSKGQDPRDIAISVKAKGAGLAEVREAARYEATQYCLFNRGSSDTDWVLDSATGDWAYTVQGEDLVVNARCRR
jgi:hypothetical protein